MTENIANLPKVGVVSPEGTVSPEAMALYGNQVQFIAANTFVKSLTPKGYEEALKNIPYAVDELLNKGVQAVSIMGTSLTFFRGRAFNEQLQKSVAEQTGLPSSTMTTAVVEGLKAVGAKRIALATAYSAEVTELLESVLEEYDLKPISRQYLNVEIDNVKHVSTENLVEISKRAVKGREADALLISCGGLRTLSATEQLEKELGIPVVSSPIAGAWATVRLVGHSGFAEGGGKLLSISK